MQKQLIIAGLAVHLILFYSIFDIYFTSPLVHGMTPHVPHLAPPAKRLVLFVADGLRADKLFELDSQGYTRAPFLRNIMEKEGAWGVSHTHVPTESRPGHVAVIAGFYEDVSAVTKGWKENPVDFDSVFNESKYTWSWGSPDILPMFAKGASSDHVFTKMYPAESEDFAGADSSKLDSWVFDQVTHMFKSAKDDHKLNDKLRENKIIFFMHLLGLDTNGHAHRPYSKEYLDNIRLVDKGVKKMFDLMENFYGDDGSTAYVLTSDHGMTNWGSHGAGHPSETLTPLITWGAGVRAPLPPTGREHYSDKFQEEWKLNHIKRTDVNQADICPLMAALIGVSFPLNSVGTLPLDYLSTPMAYKADAIFSNALQMLEQFQVKMDEKQQTTLTAFFTPYKSLLPSEKADKVRTIRALMKEEKYQDVIDLSNQLIQLAEEGLQYYHSYDRFYLGLSVTCGFVGWMSYVIHLLLREHSGIVKPRHKLDVIDLPFYRSDTGVKVIFSTLAAVIALLLLVQSLPWSHFQYCLLPVILWYLVCKNGSSYEDLKNFVISKKLFLQSVAFCVIGVLAVEIIVLSFFRRELLSVGLVAMAIWPLTTTLRTNHKAITLGWMVSCLTLAVFPLMPVVGRDANYNLVYLAGWLILFTALYCARRPESAVLPKRQTSGQFSQNLITTGVQVLLIAVCINIVNSTSSSIKDKRGLPLYNQIGSWATLASSFIIPLFASTLVLNRLFTIALAFLGPYLLLSTAHESLFVLVFCYVMFFWLELEHKLATEKRIPLHVMDFVQVASVEDSTRHLKMADFRCAYFFIFFITAAFFGTGNIASINSFDPASVYCFLTVFSPFVMGALMMWKILIPFLMVSCTFNAVHVILRVPTQSLMLVALLMSDFMGLHFFFLVRDYGSWLEIGTTISHYIIVMSMTCFLLLLLALSKFFVMCRIPLPGLKSHQL